MAFDSISNSSVSPASNASDFAKKKRGNRSAKLKQNKLDARRQQWLSQAKSNGGKEKLDSTGEIDAPLVYACNEKGRGVGSLEISSGNIEKNDGTMHNCSDSDSSSNSPTSRSSSILGSNGSGTNFTGSSSRSSCSGRSYSGNISEEDDEGCLDDWEAVADALTVDDKQVQHSNSSELTGKHANIRRSDSPSELVKRPGVVEISKPKQKVSRAWRPDDAFRPQNLPNLVKQHSFPMKSDRHCGHGSRAWVPKNVLSAPISCPICCEDLDYTDSCFLPCPCGFRLCLFCHKRIVEDDGRCPGCRKQYDTDQVANFGGGPTLQLPRSYSMITKS